LETKHHQLEHSKQGDTRYLDFNHFENVSAKLHLSIGSNSTSIRMALANGNRCDRDR
jgi:hypothetical protein